jgi:hypothetical protein
LSHGAGKPRACEWCKAPGVDAALWPFYHCRVKLSQRLCTAKRLLLRKVSRRAR